MRSFACAGGLALCVLGGCDAPDASDVRPVVVYVSVDEALARTMLGTFESDTGVPVRMVGDTEAFKSTGLAARIREESARPTADVFWSSEVVQVAMLAQDGLLEPVTSPTTQAWPECWRDAEHRWHGFSPRPRVIVWDPSRVDAASLPTTWHEALDGRFDGALAMADPRFGTTGGHLASMRQWWIQQGRPEQWEALLESLAGGRVLVLAGGNAATVDAVIRGEALIGMTDMDDVLAARRRGSVLEMAPLRHEATPGGGAMLTPNAVARVRGGPNAEGADMLIDWLLQPRAARLLAASVSANMPIQPQVQQEFPQLVIDDPLLVNHDAAARQWPAAMAEVLAALREAS